MADLSAKRMRFFCCDKDHIHKAKVTRQKRPACSEFGGSKCSRDLTQRLDARPPLERFRCRLFPR